MRTTWAPRAESTSVAPLPAKPAPRTKTFAEGAPPIPNTVCPRPAAGAQEVVGPHKRPDLTGGLGVGRTVPMAILGGKGGRLGREEGAHFLLVRGGMDTGKENVILPDEGILLGQELLHLRDQCCLFIYLFHGRQDRRANGDIGFVGISGLGPCAGLHEYLVAARGQITDFVRCKNDTAFGRFVFFQDANLHSTSPF